MKKNWKKRSLIACSAVAALSLGVAFAFPKTEDVSADVAQTNVFTFADGASIRYTSEAGKDIGLRFIALMSEDVKNNIVNSEATLGFVVSRADQFDGVSDYINMTNANKASVVISSANVEEYIYEGKDEYAGYWCANVVINKSATDEVEDFTQRSYSAAAYYQVGNDIVYASNMQERSIQLVASRVMLSGDQDWSKVAVAYPSVGTEKTPFVVEADGKNSYENMVGKVANGESFEGKYFQLTENVATQTLLTDQFKGTLEKGSYKAVELSQLYTSNHEITDVYAVNKSVDLAGKVSAEFGELTYTVKNSDGEPVSVVDNAFTPTEAGKYTVSAQVEAYAPKTFTIETADNKYVDGLVFDGNTESEVSITNQMSSKYNMTASFENDVKYDADSNGSYKLEYSNVSGSASGGWNFMSVNVKPAFSKEYYSALKANGYTDVAIRFMIDTKDIVAESSGMYFFNEVQSNTSTMKLYSNNKAIQNKTSFVFWDYQWSDVGQWAEAVIGIDKFINFYNANENGMTELFIIVVSGSKAFTNLTVYLDNAYAVKGAITETLNEPETVYQDKGTQFDMANLVAEQKDVITSATLDGNQIALADGKVQMNDYGVYSFKAQRRTAYGYVGENVITNGSIVSKTASNFSARHTTASNNSTYTGSLGANGNVVVSSGGAGKITGASMTTYVVKTLGDKSYYEALKAAGFGYVTYEYTFSYTGTIGDACGVYRFGFTNMFTNHISNLTMDATVFPYSYSSNGGEKVSSTSSRNTKQQKYSTTSWGGTGMKDKTITISIPIETYLNKYSQEMKILSLYFSVAMTTADYSVTFSKIAVTKNACVFD